MVFVALFQFIFASLWTYMIHFVVQKMVFQEDQNLYLKWLENMAELHEIRKRTKTVFFKSSRVFLWN